VGLALFTFIAIFVLIGSAGLLMAYRATMTQRLLETITPRVEPRHWLSWLKPSRAGESLGAVVQPLNKILPKSPQEVSVAQQRLMRAGYREDSHLHLFYGAKVLVPLLLCVAIPLSGHGSNVMFYLLALGLGYLIPDFWLGRRIKRRQTEIRLALPDFLDLMVVCIEAGLSLDQALARSTEEMKQSQPEIADEMGLVILEQRAGCPRLDAWRNLAQRVDLEIIRTLVAAIVQADQFGTSIAKTLRVYADGLRVRRRQQVEEMAAKTAVKLVFPLVFFIFPCIFIVALGPTILAIQDSINKYFK